MSEVPDEGSHLKIRVKSEEEGLPVAVKMVADFDRTWYDASEDL